MERIQKDQIRRDLEILATDFYSPTHRADETQIAYIRDSFQNGEMARQVYEAREDPLNLTGEFVNRIFRLREWGKTAEENGQIPTFIEEVRTIVPPIIYGVLSEELCNMGKRYQKNITNRIGTPNFVSAYIHMGRHSVGHFLKKEDIRWIMDMLNPTILSHDKDTPGLLRSLAIQAARAQIEQLRIDIDQMEENPDRYRGKMLYPEDFDQDLQRLKGSQEETEYLLSKIGEN